MRTRLRQRNVCSAHAIGAYVMLDALSCANAIHVLLLHARTYIIYVTPYDIELHHIN